MLIDLGEATRLVLGVVLVVAALAKVIDPSGLRDLLTRHGAPGSLIAVGPYLVVTIELGTVGLLVAGSALAAGMAVIGLFTAFAAVLVLSTAKDAAPTDCGCFGTLSRPTPVRWRPVLARMAGVGAGGLVVAAGGEGMGWPSTRSVWLAALELCLLVLRVPNPLQLARRASAEGAALVRSVPPPTGVQRGAMSRRSLLERFAKVAGVGAGIGVLGPLARAFACVSATMPCAASASMSSESVDHDHDHSADRSPCFHACKRTPGRRGGRGQRRSRHQCLDGRRRRCAVRLC